MSDSEYLLYLELKNYAKKDNVRVIILEELYKIFIRNHINNDDDYDDQH